MDFIIFGGLFIFFLCFGIISMKRNERREREKRFEAINPILGKPLISTEPHDIKEWKATVKDYKKVTASVIVSQPISKVIKNRWVQFFNNKKYYEKELKRASKLAVIKMKNTAMEAHLIVNTRVQTSIIRSGKLLEPDKICAIAYGTAITYY